MTPLAEQLRPKNLEEWVGHSDIMSPGKPLFEAIRNDRLFSFILYAPPGSGKTSLCHLIKNHSKSRFISLSAVTSGVKDLKAAIEGAVMWKQSQSQDTILFIDEIHRFSKSQQDVLLGAMERGEIILIGATTENPSFELNAALLSRSRVFRMEALTEENLLKIIERAVEAVSKRTGVAVEEGVVPLIVKLAQGDARVALNTLELALPDVSLSKIREVFKTKILSHDKAGDFHYQVVSAFIKSMRAGQTEAALYYMARMWAAGEDPLFIARRMVIFASEDVGNVDLKAIALANAVRHAVEFVGRPECYYALAQGVIYLSRAPKSREVGDMFSKALSRVEKSGALPVPDFLMNAVTSLNRDLGRGRERLPDESYLPSDLLD